MGLQLNVINFKFDDIIPALNAGQFDVVISAMTITDERAEVVDFVPYFNAGQAVLVQKGNPKGIKTLDDLSGQNGRGRAGHHRGANPEGAQRRSWRRRASRKVNVLTYPTDTDAVDQLRVGRADATLHDSPVAAYYAELNPNAFEVAIAELQLGAGGHRHRQEQHGHARCRSTAAIKAMKADGTLNAIMAKWGISSNPA